MLILASQSPRRKELLERAGIAFEVRVAGIPESPEPGEKPRDYALRLACSKAAAIAGDQVLGADTIVVLDDQILEKPEDAEDARRMLRLLSGRTHRVITGVCLRSGANMQADACETLVRFSHLTEGEIHDYVASGEPMGKAGAYAIQGLASKFVEHIEGDYCNIVGLPVHMVYNMLKSV